MTEILNVAGRVLTVYCSGLIILQVKIRVEDPPAQNRRGCTDHAPGSSTPNETLTWRRKRRPSEFQFPFFLTFRKKIMRNFVSIGPSNKIVLALGY